MHRGASSPRRPVLAQAPRPSLPTATAVQRMLRLFLALTPADQALLIELSDQLVHARVDRVSGSSALRVVPPLPAKSPG